MRFCRAQDIPSLVLRETPTLGVRFFDAKRVALERRFDPVKTPWGEVKVKVGLHGGQVLNATPEFEDCRAIARAANVPLKDVIAAALAAWRHR